MSQAAYFVKGTAVVRLEGVARIVDMDGNIVKERDLSELGDLTLPIIAPATDLYVSEFDQCGVTFAIDDVFSDEAREA